MSRGLMAVQESAGQAVGVPGSVGRRSFLVRGVTICAAAAGGGLLLGVTLPAAAQGRTGTAASQIGGDANIAQRSGVFEPNAFIQIDRAGAVTLVMPKVEMGQGIYTAISMLIAEELEVPLDSVVVRHAPPDAKLYTDPLLGGQVTGGSTSIRYAWEPMRKAGATARVMLVAAAAQKWRVDPASCCAERGEVIHAASGRRVGYGQLADIVAGLPVPKSVTLKDPKDFKLIGTSVKRLDSPDKVNGAAVFGIDVRVPGMLYAVIVNCPVFGGTLASMDDQYALKIPGVRKVIRIDNAVAVLGDHTWAAKRGAAALDIKWNEGRTAGFSTAKVVKQLVDASKREGAVARKDGDIVKGFDNAKTRVDAMYHQPFLAHATMEPVNCTVSVRADGCDIWVGTQVPTRAVDTAAKLTGLPAERIAVHNHLLGGGFGRRAEVDFITQALKVGKQAGAPVKVTWTREEDLQHDMYRPCYYDTISAGLDATGKPIAWRHRVVGSSIVARIAPPAFRNGLDPDAVEVAADLPYALPNQLIDYVRQEPMDIPTTFWRGVGAGRSTFVVESFMDELAAQAKVDPVKYRMDRAART
jgi:isoquinoline 1-oxidoreductase beta subunit